MPRSSEETAHARRPVPLRLVAAVEAKIDEWRYRLAYRLGRPGPIQIVPYRGYGTRQRIYLQGRVLEDRGVTQAGLEDSAWTNLRNTYRRLASREVPYARIHASLHDETWELRADDEGMFELWTELTHILPEDQLWHDVHLTLLEPSPKEPASVVEATGQIFVPPPGVAYAVISDIDDTVIISNVRHLWRMAQAVLMSNAHTRLPFSGVAALYRALAAGPDASNHNPVFFVSSSPVNFYDLLNDFFVLRQISSAPLLSLRNWGISETEILPLSHRRYKRAVMTRILDLFTHLPFILIGDSGQQDPEIYHALVHEHPDRILAVYIRHVCRRPDRVEAVNALATEVALAGSTLVLAQDSLGMAQHAASQKWITEEWLEQVREEMAGEDDGTAAEWRESAPLEDG